MKEASPAFRFYPADFLSDSQVSAMSMAERGLYITLLCHAWRDGSLPSDAEEIARMVREPASAFRKMWPRVSPCFTLREDGRLIQGRLEAERYKQREYHASKAEAGKKGAESRWNGKKEDGKAMTVPLANDGVRGAKANDGGSLSSSLSNSVESKDSTPLLAEEAAQEGGDALDPGERAPAKQLPLLGGGGEPKKPRAVKANKPEAEWVSPLLECVEALMSRKLSEITHEERFEVARYHCLKFANCTRDESKNRSKATNVASGLASIATTARFAEMTVRDYISATEKTWEAGGKNAIYRAWDGTAFASVSTTAPPWASRRGVSATKIAGVVPGSIANKIEIG